jgi:RimJ/RimL family protein N-acetyltransferase
MVAQVELRPVSRQDVARIAEWLTDAQVAEAWFGRYTYGDPVHLGYDPRKITHTSDEEWKGVFGPHKAERAGHQDHRDIFSVYTKSGEHIGEGHLHIEERLGDAHLSILIGRKDLWGHGYGTAAALALLEHAFDHLELYRVWVDVPTYNMPARNMFEHLGFQHEGTLRKSRPHAGARHDSFIMGILRDEFHRLYPQGVSSHVVTRDSPNV